MFLEKGVLKICWKLIREHQCRSVISIELPSNFTEITPRHRRSPEYCEILRNIYSEEHQQTLAFVGKRGPKTLLMYSKCNWE